MVGRKVADEVANAGADQEIGKQGTPKTIQLSASTSFFRPTDTTTRAPSATAWAIASMPGGATAPTFANQNAATTNVTFGADPVVGTYVFRATVREGPLPDGITDTDDVNVFVKPFVTVSV